jgi:hypothetical protein
MPYEPNHEPEPAPSPEGLQAVSTLRDLYLAVGLNTDAALRSALADYTCHFLPVEESCAA